MRRFSKTGKKGFTLIEIMIAMAIMVVMMSIIWATFAIVNQSHANVVVVNDAKDFAEFNMEAIENMLANADKVMTDNDPILDGTDAGLGFTKSAFFDSGNGKLMYFEGAVPNTALDIEQFKVTNSSGVDVNKWYIVPTFTLNGFTLNAQLEVYDSADNALYYTLSRAIYLSNVTTSTPSSPGPVIKFHTKAFPS